MDFFSSCTSQEQAKSIFRTLSKHFHPDKGGDVQLMTELRKQYDEFPNRRKEHIKPLDYAAERERSWQKGINEEEIRVLRGVVLGMQASMMDLIERKDELDSVNREIMNWSFFRRIMFMVFGKQFIEKMFK